MQRLSTTLSVPASSSIGFVKRAASLSSVRPGTRLSRPSSAKPEHRSPVKCPDISSSTTNDGPALTTVFILPFVFSKFSREAKRLHPFFMSCRMRSTRRKSRSRQKKTGTRRSSPRSRRNVVFPMRNPSSRSTGFVPSGRTCLLQYDTRGGRTFRRRLKGIARAHPAVLHCRYTSRRHCIEDPITQRRKP